MHNANLMNKVAVNLLFDKSFLLSIYIATFIL